MKISQFIIVFFTISYFFTLRAQNNSRLVSAPQYIPNNCTTDCSTITIKKGLPVIILININQPYPTFYKNNDTLGIISKNNYDVNREWKELKKHFKDKNYRYYYLDKNGSIEINENSNHIREYSFLDTKKTYEGYILWSGDSLSHPISKTINLPILESPFYKLTEIFSSYFKQNYKSSYLEKYYKQDSLFTILSKKIEPSKELLKSKLDYLQLQFNNEYDVIYEDVIKNKPKNIKNISIIDKSKDTIRTFHFDKLGNLRLHGIEYDSITNLPVGFWKTKMSYIQDSIFLYNKDEKKVEKYVRFDNYFFQTDFWNFDVLYGFIPPNETSSDWSSTGFSPSSFEYINLPYKISYYKDNDLCSTEPSDFFKRNMICISNVKRTIPYTISKKRIIDDDTLDSTLIESMTVNYIANGIEYIFKDKDLIKIYSLIKKNGKFHQIEEKENRIDQSASPTRYVYNILYEYY